MFLGGAWIAVYASEQLGWADIERRGYLQDVGQARIACPALDSADVGPVQTALQRQTFLRGAASVASCANRLTEDGVRW